MYGLRAIADLVAADKALDELRDVLTKAYVGFHDEIRRIERDPRWRGEDAPDSDEYRALMDLYRRVGWLRDRIYSDEIDRGLHSIVKDTAALIEVSSDG